MRPVKALFVSCSIAVLAAFVSLRAEQTRPGPGVSGPGAAAPLSVIDAAGRTVRFEKPPARIVVAGHGTHIVLHLLYLFPEGREKLAGVERWSDPASDFIPLIDPAFDKVPYMEPNAGAEEIAAMRPDVVLTRGSSVNWISESMDKIGIPVVYLGLETSEQYFRDLDNLGILLGNPARAKEVAGFFRTRLDRIGGEVSKIREAEKPRVLLVMWTERGGKAAVRVPAGSWIQTNQVRMAGGAPVWLDATLEAGGWTVVNLEQIAAWDPDMIFVVVWHTLDPTKILDSLKADPRWSELKALRNGQLRAFPADIYGWDSPDPRWILGVTWLAAKIHPKIFANIDIAAEIRAFYGELYGMTERAVADKIVPAIKADLR
jgi:iron complex transport system substrate-binding protein